jgi:hypothetical protein
MVLDSQCSSSSRSPALHHCFCFFNVDVKPHFFCSLSFNSPYTSEMALFVKGLLMDSLIWNMYLCFWKEYNCFATNYLKFSYIKLSVYTPWKRTDGVEIYLHSLLTSSLGLDDSNRPWPFYPLSLSLVFTLTSKLGLPQFFRLNFLFLSLLQKFS